MSPRRPRRPRAAEESDLLLRNAPLGLPTPAYGGRSIANLPSTLWTAVRGSPPPAEWGLLPALDPSLDPFAARRAPGPTLLFVVDGLGWFPYRDWGRHRGAAVSAWSAWARPVTTVFPTTTTAALTSLSTGTAPGTHGLVGYRQYLPRFGVVADILRMSPVGLAGSDLLVQRGFRPSLISGAPTVFRRGLEAVAVSRDRFERSGFTRVLYDGARYVPYATAADLAHELVRLLSAERPPAVVYAYWDELDTIQHLRGPTALGLFDLEMDHVAALLDYVAAALPPRRARTTTLLMTGDHGQVPAAIEHQLRVDRWGAVVREMAHPLAGDRRAGFFSAKSGRVDALATALARVLPPGSRILRMDDVLAAGLFGPGPFHPELSQRLGDLLTLVPASWGLRDLIPGAPPPARHLFGAHGGLDPEELLVPLVAGPLAEFRTSSRSPRRRPQR